MHQFFVEDCQIGREYVTITGSDVRHIGKVLRMKPGETIRISSTGGQNLYCSISELTDEFVQAEILDRPAAETELPARIHLYMGIPKGDRMESVIQKGVELGVYEIIPVSMQYCVVRLDEKKAASKIKRWQAISESAAKQSKRSLIPRVSSVHTFEEAKKEASDFDLCIVPYENANGMKQLKETLGSLKKGTDIAVFIGPEGGFSEKEIESVREIAVEVSLGKRILRTDTAAITTLASMMLALEMQEDE
ncbi:MAG: 16S rRNA (uracil(1498)-N(3))-methyltransferase [Lachnospiraceae bacterium]|nr:16S rRNA (uracil(1498)-N(3))-methyltransferase [Lachnospiraceae bacterium]